MEQDSFSGSVEIVFRSKARGKFVALNGKAFNIRSLSMYECAPNDPDCYGDINADERNGFSLYERKIEDQKYRSLIRKFWNFDQS